MSDFENIPEGLIRREFPAETFTKFSAKGKMPDAVVKKWKHIWSEDKNINRKYSYDFELYNKELLNNKEPLVEIFIATK